MLRIILFGGIDYLMKQEITPYESNNVVVTENYGIDMEEGMFTMHSSIWKEDAKFSNAFH